MSYSRCMTVRKNLARYKEIVHLKDVKGLTFREIGEKLHISRQRAQQQYARTKTKKGKNLPMSSHVKVKRKSV